MDKPIPKVTVKVNWTEREALRMRETLHLGARLANLEHDDRVYYMMSGATAMMAYITRNQQWLCMCGKQDCHAHKVAEEFREAIENIVPMVDKKLADFEAKGGSFE